MSNPSLILPQSPAYGEDYVYAAQVYDGEVPVYDVLPLTFTRASGGSRINKDGLVQNMPYNLVQYSEEFNNAAWIQAGSTVTANNTTAPNGATTADKIVAQATNTEHGVYNATPYASNFVGEIYTYSVYAKKGSVDWLVLDHYQGSYTFTWFNLNTGTLGTVASGVTATIESVGNGWYRCSCTKAITATSVNYIGIYLSNANNTWSFNASGAESIYIWGAQVNIGSTAQPYLATTDRLNMPRITYPVGGGCGALLLEKQSTNYAIYSEDLTQYNSNISGGTVGANATTSPDGTQNADSFTVNTASSAHSGFYESPNGTNGQPFTTSIFLKAGTGRYFLFRAMTNSYSTRYGVTIDLQTGTILSSNTQGSPTGTSSKIENFGNGWYRVMLTMNTIGTQIAGVWGTSNTATPSLDAYLDYSYTGNGTDSYYIWGMTLENSAYATSYISTTSASSTRIADACYKTGISNLIGQTEGTLFAEMSAQDSPANNWFQILDGSANNWIFIGLDGSRFRGYVRFGSSTVFDNLTFSLTNGVPAKIALAYKSGDIALYINGSQIAVSSNTFTPSASLSQMVFGDLINPPQDCAQYNQAKIYKTRLTNSELATLTTL